MPKINEFAREYGMTKYLNKGNPLKAILKDAKKYGVNPELIKQAQERGKIIGDFFTEYVDKKKDYNEVEENEIFIGKQGDLAKTSPLLECAGLLIYSNTDRQGVLVHWQDKGIESLLCDALFQLKLRNPDAVIAGCGIPIECSIEDSQPYIEVRSFLEARKIPIRKTKVGLDYKVELEANFSDGSYKIN